MMHQVHWLQEQSVDKVPTKSIVRMLTFKVKFLVCFATTKFILRTMIGYVSPNLFLAVIGLFYGEPTTPPLIA